MSVSSSSATPHASRLDSAEPSISRNKLPPQSWAAAAAASASDAGGGAAAASAARGSGGRRRALAGLC